MACIGLRLVLLAAPEESPAPVAIAPADSREKIHWAFQPVRRPDPSVPAISSGAITPIDSLLLEPLRKAGISANPPATRRELLRRVHHDLIGLPPSLDEIREFETDVSPDAYALRIEQLLASPRY